MQAQCSICYLTEKTSSADTSAASHQVPASITAASPPAVEEEAKEDGEEFEDLSAMLEHLGLSEYKKTFDEERIDIESFVSSANTNAFKKKTQCITLKLQPDIFIKSYYK